MKKEEQELLDIKFGEKARKQRDKHIDLLSSEGETYLQKLKEKKEQEETIDNNTFLDDNMPSKDEFEIEVDELKKTDADNSSKNLNNIFEIVNNNVKEATNLFNKNIEMKKKIEDELKSLEQSKTEFEDIKNEEYSKIKKYREEVLEKLRVKKEEVEASLATLKDTQIKIINEKNKFEKYKRDEITKIKKIEEESRNNLELEKIKIDELKKSIEQEKEKLEEEKRNLELDRIKYENDKNELTNNLMRFNDLVGDFTIGIDRFNLDD